MLLEERKQADENWLDIQEIMKSPECWAYVERYDVELCHIKKRYTGEFVWEGTTGSVLKILEDTCNAEMSFERRIRKIKRIARELERLGENL